MLAQLCLESVKVPWLLPKKFASVGDSSDAMPAGGTSRLIGGREGGRAKISLPSRDADEVQGDSGSSSVNAAATAVTVGGPLSVEIGRQPLARQS